MKIGFIGLGIMGRRCDGAGNTLQHSTMSSRLLLTLAFAHTLAATTIALAADQPLKPQWLMPDQVLYQDDFSKPSEIATTKQQAELPWIVNQGTRWEVVEGVLRGRASSAEFQAAHETHQGLHPRIVLQATPEKYVLQFSMRLVDGIPFEAGKRKSVAPFIEIGHHICRVTPDVNGATLLADGDTTQLAVDKDFKLIPGKWETVMIERRDSEVLVQFANGPVFHGKHPSYASESHAVMLAGLEAGVMEIDNVTLSSVKEGVQPQWEAFLAKLPPQQNIVLRPKTPGFLAKEAKAAKQKAAEKTQAKSKTETK
jgi:hypothetical protein